MRTLDMEIKEGNILAYPDLDKVVCAVDVKNEFLNIAKKLAEVMETNEQDMEKTVWFFANCLNVFYQKHYFKTQIPSWSGLQDMELVWKMANCGSKPYYDVEVALSINPKLGIDKYGKLERIRHGSQLNKNLSFSKILVYTFFLDLKKLKKQLVNLFTIAFNQVKQLNDEAERMRELGYKRIALNRFCRFVKMGEITPDSSPVGQQDCDVVFDVYRTDDSFTFAAKELGEDDGPFWERNDKAEGALDQYAVKHEIEFLRYFSGSRMQLLMGINKKLSDQMILMGE